jgi:hypothetical protein
VWSVTCVKWLELSFDAGRGVQSHDGISSARQMPDGRRMSVRGGSFQSMLPLRPKMIMNLSRQQYLLKMLVAKMHAADKSRTNGTVVLHSYTSGAWLHLPLKETCLQGHLIRFASR